MQPWTCIHIGNALISASPSMAAFPWDHSTSPMPAVYDLRSPLPETPLWLRRSSWLPQPMPETPLWLRRSSWLPQPMTGWRNCQHDTPLGALCSSPTSWSTQARTVMLNSKCPKGAFQGFSLQFPLHCPVLVALQLSQSDHFQKVLQQHFLQQELGLSYEGSCFVLDWENQTSSLRPTLTAPLVAALLQPLLRPHAMNPRYGVVKVKEKQDPRKEETSDNIRRWKLTWALCNDNACHLCSYVTWQAGARKATWQLLHNMAAVFANTKTHSGPKQIIVYHGHETTLPTS